MNNLSPKLVNVLKKIAAVGGNHPLMTLGLTKPELLAITATKLVACEMVKDKGFVLRILPEGQKHLVELGQPVSQTPVAAIGQPAVLERSSIVAPPSTPAPVEAPVARQGFTFQIPAGHPRALAKQPPQASAADQRRLSALSKVQAIKQAGAQQLNQITEAAKQVLPTAAEARAHARNEMFNARGVSRPNRNERSESQRFYEGDQGYSMREKEVTSWVMPKAFYQGDDSGTTVRDLNGVSVNMGGYRAGTMIPNTPTPQLQPNLAAGAKRNTREALVQRMQNQSLASQLATVR